MRKKNGIGRINLCDFRLYSKATVIKTIWYWHKDRNIDQWDKIESPELNPHSMDTLSLTKEARIYNKKKDNLFNNWCREKEAPSTATMENSVEIPKKNMEMELPCNPEIPLLGIHAE